MSKTVDVDLRIRAKNLSKSSLKDITDDVEALTQAQVKQASSADLAARSMKELVAEQQRAAALSKELGERRAALQNYIDERAEIDALTKKLAELKTARDKLGPSKLPKNSAAAAEAVGLDKSLKDTETRLRKLTDASETSRLKMEALGVDTREASASLAAMGAAADKASGAQARALANVNGYAAAVQRANDASAEATRRTKEEAAAREKLDKARAGDVRRTVGPNSPELSALRQDIELRSAQARAVEVAAEAQRRLRVEEQLQASSLAKNNAAVREAVQLLETRRARQKALEDVFGKQLTLQEREQRVQNEANARRQRLIALIQSERGQRLLGLEAQRRDTNETERNTKAKEKQGRAAREAAKEEAFFADTGRKSLSVYQRMRGQILGLITAYVGVYQAVRVLNDAIGAVNRNQSLKIGLNVANNGDTKKAAADYKFLREEADRLGLVFDDIAPKYANMVIAAKAVGVSMKQTRQLFTDVATSVAAGNLSIDDSEGVFRAVVQVMGKARVQAEELRGQLGDRLPGAVAEFAKANGIALTDLDEHLKKGKGTIEQFLKFMNEYAQKYAPAMVETTDRLQASINRAKNAYNDWLRRLLDSTAQSKLKEAFGRMAEFFNSRDGEVFAQKLGAAFSFLVDRLLWAADNIDLVARALKIFISIQLIKFGIDAAGSIVGLGTALRTAGASAFGATGQVTGFARALGFVKLGLGGLAVLIGGVTLAIQSQSEILAQAESDLRRYANLMDRVGRRAGVAKAATSAEATENIKAIAAESAATFEKLKRLEAFKREAQRAQTGGTADKLGFILKTGTQSVLGGEAKDLGITLGTTMDDLQKRIDAARNKIFNLREMVVDELSVRLELTGKELQEAADEAAKTVTTANVKTEKEKKEPKGRAPEDIARQQEAAQSALVALASRTEEEIAQARIQKGAATDAQIEVNRLASLEKIKQDTIQSLEQVEAVRRQYEAAGLDTAKDPRFAQMAGLLKQLEAAKVARIEEDTLAAKIALREQAINDLIEERNAKITLQNTLRDTGQQSALTTQTNVNALQDDYNAKILVMTDEFMAFLMALDPSGELYQRLGIAKTLEGLKLINAENAKLTTGQKIAKKWGEEFANAGANMLKAFSDAYAATGSLKEGFRSAADAFRQFIADFLMQIAQAIIQAIILQAIMNAINNQSGGYGAAVGAALGAAGHTGGVVRSGNKIGANPRRLVSPLVFAGAQKFHEGGLPGLKRDEVAAVLKKGEEVVTENDPRHVGNGGAAGGPSGLNVSVINSMNPDEVAGMVLKSKVAGPTIINLIGRNAGAVKQALGVGR